MTRVDFYVVADAGPEARLSVAARLADKVLAKGHTLFINACDRQQAEQLDAMLWSYRSASFIPHSLCEESENEPVVIGWGQEPTQHDDVLINLDSTAPTFFSRFSRVAEIVTQDHEHMDALRDAWRFYRDRGYPLTKHDL